MKEILVLKQVKDGVKIKVKKVLGIPKSHVPKKERLRIYIRACGKHGDSNENKHPLSEGTVLARKELQSPTLQTITKIKAAVENARRK